MYLFSILAALIVAALVVLAVRPALARYRVAQRKAAALAKAADIMAASRARYGHGAYVMELTHSNPVIQRLEEQRQAQLDFIDQLCGRVESEARDMVEAERANVEAARQRVAEIDEQLTPLYAFEETRAAHRSTSATYRPDARPTAPQGEEQRGTGLGYTQPRGHEYRTRGQLLADASCATADGNDPMTAQMREAALSRLESAGYALRPGDGLVRAVATQVSSDTAGILPEAIVGEVVSDIDAARPFISSVGVQDLAGIPGKVFHRPIVTQHTTAGAQAGPAELGELPSQKMVIGDVDFTKRLRGGSLKISRQDIDWTSPSAWDALLKDMQEVYAVDTENLVADDFVTAVTAVTATDVAAPLVPTLNDWLKGLYDAAKLSYAGVKRLPNTIWCSLDMWASMGPLVDQLKASTGGNGGGDSAIDSFAGNLLQVPRIVVPSFADGTLIVGVKERTEVYEQQLGFLSAVIPSLWGVEIATGGYIANGTLNAAGFAKVTFV